VAGADGQCPGGACFAVNVCRCENGSHDGNETAVDCGGSCPACPNGQGCGPNGDANCQSGNCCSCCGQNICKPAGTCSNYSHGSCSSC
jgi:hypothetical protein